MRTYIIKRLLLVIPTMILASLIIFCGMRLIPGSAIDLMVREAGIGSYGKVDRASIEQALGLDQPVYVQYGRWVGVVRDADGNFSGILQGSLGNSLWEGTPVLDEIVDRLPTSIELGLLGILIMVIGSVPMGIYSAIRQDSISDYAVRVWATALIALPGFWVALMAILVGSLWFGSSPPLFYIPFIEDPIGNLRQFAVPAFLLGMHGAGTNMRMVRSMMLEVLRQDYIRTAWAKGLRERVVIARHAVKNALIPVLTIVGAWVPMLVGGTVIIEIIFSMPGMGRLLLDAVSRRDYTVVSGIVFMYAIILVIANLAVDLTYGYLDPRIRYR